LAAAALPAFMLCLLPPREANLGNAAPQATIAGDDVRRLLRYLLPADRRRAPVRAWWQVAARQ
jgi:hypothetical protein